MESEVALEALSGGQVGQAAELGTVGGVSLAVWSGLSWALCSDWDLPGAPAHLSAPRPASTDPSSCLAALCHLTFCLPLPASTSR